MHRSSAGARASVPTREPNGSRARKRATATRSERRWWRRCVPWWAGGFFNGQGRYRRGQDASVTKTSTAGVCFFSTRRNFAHSTPLVSLGVTSARGTLTRVATERSCKVRRLPESSAFPRPTHLDRILRLPHHDATYATRCSAVRPLTTSLCTLRESALSGRMHMSERKPTKHSIIHNCGYNCDLNVARKRRERTM